MARHPFGTTQTGHLILGLVSVLSGIGSALGLYLLPKVFTPIVIMVLGAISRGHLIYDDAHRPFYAALLAGMGVLMATLFAYAFMRHPKEISAIDKVFLRRDMIDSSQRSSLIEPKNSN